MRSCVGVRADWLDTYVEERVVGWLGGARGRASVFGAREDDSAVAAAARAGLERLQVKIGQWRKIGEDPESDPRGRRPRRSRGLTKKLAAAEELARPASLSPQLAALLTVPPDRVADEWVRIRDSGEPVARQIIKMIADIRVAKSSRGRGGTRPGGQRSISGLTQPRLLAVAHRPGERIHDIGTDQRCVKCGELKPLTEFYPANRRCKTCVLERQRRYREDNRELVREQQDNRRETSRDSGRRWREENREADRERKRRWREASRESVLAQRAASREAVLAHYSPFTPPRCAHCCARTEQLRPLSAT